MGERKGKNKLLLARVHENCHKILKYSGGIVANELDFRQLTNVLGMYWRKSSGLSPIGECPRGVLAKVKWTLANWRVSWGCTGESPLGESHIGEDPGSLFSCVNKLSIATECYAK